MKGLKRTFWLCCSIQALLVLSLVLVKSLSLRDALEIPGNLWFVPMIYISNCLLCSAILGTQFYKTLKKVALNEHGKVLSFTIDIKYGFSEIFSVFNDDMATKQMIKRFFIFYFVLLFVIFIEVIFAVTLLI